VDGLLGGDRRVSWSAVREHLSDMYVRSQVTEPFFDPLFLSGFLSLAMFGEDHGAPAQFLRDEGATLSHVQGRIIVVVWPLRWWSSGGAVVATLYTAPVYNVHIISYVCVCECVCVCV